MTRQQWRRSTPSHHPGHFAPSRSQRDAEQSSDPAQLESLARSKSSFTRSAVAKNPATPTATLIALAHGEDHWVRRAVASNPYSPATLLDELADDDQDVVRVAVAYNPTTSPSTLARLAADTDAKVRNGVARNPHAPSETVDRLASSDRDPAVLKHAAKNEALSDEALIHLAQVATEDIAYALCGRNRNPDGPTRVIETTRFDGRASRTVSVTVPVELGGRFSAEVLTAFAASPNQRLRREAAAQPDTPAAVLAALALDDDPWTRVRVAENAAAEPAHLLALIGKGDTNVLEAVAKRDDLTVEVLDALAATRSTRSHTAMGVNEHLLNKMVTSGSVRTRVIAAQFVPLDGADLQDLLMGDPEPQVREAMTKALPARRLPEYTDAECVLVRRTVAERCTDETALTQMATDPDKVVRRRLAANPALPSAPVALLAADVDDRVRTIIAERFLRALGSSLGGTS